MLCMRDAALLRVKRQGDGECHLRVWKPHSRWAGEREHVGGPTKGSFDGRPLLGRRPPPHTSRPKRTWRPKQRTLSNSWNSSNQTAKPKLRIVPGSLSVFAVSRSLTKTAAPTKKIWQLPPSNGRLPYTTCGEKKMGSNCDYAHFV